MPRIMPGGGGQTRRGLYADVDKPRRRRSDLVADAPPAMWRYALLSGAEPRMIRANFRCSGVDMPTSAGIEEGDSRRAQSLGGPDGRSWHRSATVSRGCGGLARVGGAER